MNWDQFEGKWRQVRGSIKERFGKLTDDDLQVISGNRDKLIGKIQERYGIVREEAQKRADEWARTLQETHASSEPTKTQTGKP